MNHDPQTLSYLMLLCHHWAGHGGSRQAKQGKGMEDEMSPLQGTVWLWFQSATTAPGPRGALQSYPSCHPCKNTLAFLPNPAPAQTWICTSAGPWSFCIFIYLWGSKKIFMTFSKQQSSCASLKFPTWQCAGSWRRLQTKPKLWQLVWSLHLC